MPIRGPLSECKQARFAEGTEQCNSDEIRDEAEAEASSRFRQGWRDEQRIKRARNWSGVWRGRMRTVSRDDQLVERGANPGTGLVSPFVVSDQRCQILHRLLQP